MPAFSLMPTNSELIRQSVGAKQLRVNLSEKTAKENPTIRFLCAIVMFLKVRQKYQTKSFYLLRGTNGCNRRSPTFLSHRECSTVRGKCTLKPLSPFFVVNSAQHKQIIKISILISATIILSSSLNFHAKQYIIRYPQ